MKQLITFLFVLISSFLFAQEKPNHLNVFLDCSNNGSNCYYDYVRQELSLITFVRDRTDADVHLLLKSNWNTQGTQITTLFVIGKRAFESKNDTINYSAPPSFTDDEKRKQLVKSIKIALLPYISKTTLVEKIVTEFKRNEGEEILKDSVAKKKDPYNFWVFQFGLSGSYSGNQVSKDANGNGYFFADRETPKTKTNFYINASEQYSKYESQGDVYEYDFQQFGVGIDHVKKLNEQIAFGTGANFNNSIYSNLKTQFTAGPKIEYSIFPYKKFNNIRWVIGYAIDARNNNYYDTTIYLKTKEFFFAQEANSIFSNTQEWGSINLGIFWRNLMQDWQKNNLSFSGAISLKVAKGLNMAIWGNYNFVRNQINIRKGDATIDQLLAQNREILSNYNFDIGVGMSYRFGSKFNDAVNPSFKGMSYSINY